MNKIYSLSLCIALSCGYLQPAAYAQVTDSIKNTPADTLKKFEEPKASTQKQSFFKSKGFRATIAPAIFIGYGLSTIKDNGFYSSYEAKADIQRNFPNFHTTVDDYLIYAPYAELALAYFLQHKGNHDFLNTAILIVKAEAINAVAVFGLKSITKQERPNGENNYSLPSGHTAHAFFTGAGIGILSSHLAYLTHRNRWGEKPSLTLAPTYLFGTPALGFALDLHQVHNRKIAHQTLKAPKHKI